MACSRPGSRCYADSAGDGPWRSSRRLLLLPVAWSLLTDSHQVVLGILLTLIVVPALVLLFSPPTTRWLAQDYAPDADDAA